MFHLHYGNDLRGLARRLGERIAAPCADLLVPQVVLIPQTGMRRWLEIELAEARGIVANVDFRLPGEFVWELLRANHATLPQRSAFDREVLRWRLLPLLAELATEPVGASIAHYLRGDSDQLKRLQLAREFAGALERYQAYRRDLLARWERGADPDDWQAEAWRRLVRASDEPHRAQLIGGFLARYADGRVRPLGLPSRLGVFGCLGISPDVLRVLGTLALHCEVDFHLPSPCAEYWGDLRSVRERLRGGASPLEEAGQPLLASWGRVGREFFEQVFSYDEVQPADEEAVLRRPTRAHLLGRLQADILDLRTPAADERAAHPDPADVSLRVHVCHSALREVEVLHDRLLALFAGDATLQPRDIAVMMPDVGAYAPAVDAVFGALPPGDARRIPYTIADRRAQDEHPIVAVFLQLASLPASRWRVSELLDLLAVPAVMRRQDLDAEALDNLRHWFDLAGVRWGLDAGTRVAFGAGDYRAFTWAEGIERLLAGYASGDDHEVEGIAPVPAPQGHAADALGQALGVLRELERLAAAQRTARPAREWQALYQRALAALLPADIADRDERRALESVRGALAALAEGAVAGACHEPLDWRTVRAFLGERLAEAEPQQRFLAGGVSFCGMVPLRAIPFRVIAVLGLDDAAFPRREIPRGINLLEQPQRLPRERGDRSVRDDDRYLLLQLLTAADDVLHLSYVGRDRRSGNACEPSPLVGELLDVVTRDYFIDAKTARAALVVEHPLQPFARRVFDGSDARLFTWRNEWRAAAAASRGASAQEPFLAAGLADAADEPRRLALDRLIEFWRNPARAFLRDRLHLDLYRHDELPPDDDPLELTHLAQYHLKRALVADALATGRSPPREADAQARVRRQLPVGAAGTDAYRGGSWIAARIAAQVQVWRARNEALPPVAFELALDEGWTVECTLQQPYRGGLLHWTPGTLRGNHWLRPWIEYLALSACTARARLGFGEKIVCAQVALGKHGAVLLELPPIEADVARRELAGLLQGWCSGQSAPLAFFPKAAWTYMSMRAGPGRGTSADAALRAARASFLDEAAYDRWTALAFRDRDPFAEPALVEAFECEAQRVFARLAGLVHGAAA